MSEMSLSDVLPGGGDDRLAGRRSAVRGRERRKKRKRRRSFLALILALAVLGGGGWLAYAGLAPIVSALREPDDWTGNGTTEVLVEIPAGASGTTIGRVLAAKGVVKTQKAFVKEVNGSPAAQSIQPGTYRVRLHMSSAAAIAALVDEGNRVTLKVTIPEGQRVPEVVARLAKSLDLSKKELTAAARDGEAIGLPAAAKGNAEGFLFPATYEFGPDVTPTEALRTMVERTTAALTEAGVPEKRWREVMIKASIVQAEGRRKKDMPKIARVLENRLRIGKLLQLDSTVSYAVGRFAITTTAEERAVDSPYNTYRRKGLPAGPIDSPGLDAIRAAMKPTPGKWLYFVGVNPQTGETKFAVTAAGHAKNVAEFQAWMKAHG